MRKLLLAALANALFSAAALAQQAVPLDRVPEGRRVPGWAVDKIPTGERRDRMPIESYFGRKGLSSSRAGSPQMMYTASGEDTTVEYGRAILRIDKAGDINLIFSGQILFTRYMGSCSYILRVSNSNMLSGRLMSGRRNPSPAFGGVYLTPGYYPIEYLLRCELVQQATYSIMIRTEGDYSPRPLRDSELFFVDR